MYLGQIFNYFYIFRKTSIKEQKKKTFRFVNCSCLSKGVKVWEQTNLLIEITVNLSLISHWRFLQRFSLTVCLHNLIKQ